MQNKSASEHGEPRVVANVVEFKTNAASARLHRACGIPAIRHR